MGEFFLLTTGFLIGVIVGCFWIDAPMKRQYGKMLDELSQRSHWS